MLGLGDGWIFLAYLLCILSSIACVVYGAMNWNKGDEEITEEERTWAAHEDKVEQEL